MLYEAFPVKPYDLPNSLYAHISIIYIDSPLSAFYCCGFF